MIKINPIPLHNTQQKITNVKFTSNTFKTQSRTYKPHNVRHIPSSPHNNITSKQLDPTCYQTTSKKKKLA